MSNVISQDYYEHEWSISWSGGKDSTATIIKAIELKIPIKEIVYIRLMYDETFPAVIPKIDDFVMNTAERFREQGLNIRIVYGKKTAREIADTVYRRSIYPHKNGKRYSMVCFIRGLCKMQPNKEADDITNPYRLVGYCADETDRIHRLTNEKRSLLVDLGITQEQAKEICREHGMLSPIYTELGYKRDGCWFCPSASPIEIKYLKDNYPELYNMMRSEYDYFVENIHDIKDPKKERSTFVRHFYQQDMKCYEDKFSLLGEGEGK